MKKTKKKRVPVSGLPAMGVVRDVNVSDLFPAEEIRKIYPVNDYEVDRMIDNLNENGLLYPLIAFERDGTIQVLDGDIRRHALLKMGVNTIPVIIKRVANEDIVPVSILINQRKRKTWEMRGKEVHFLLEYAGRHLSDLMQNDESITRSNDWVAKQLGFKSQTRVDQLVKIVAYDDTLLNRVDAGEFSFAEAYNKVIRKPATPPVVNDLDKNNVQHKCNCPFFKNDEGVICPKFTQLMSEKGGDNVAA